MFSTDEGLVCDRLDALRSELAAEVAHYGRRFRSLKRWNRDLTSYCYWLANESWWPQPKKIDKRIRRIALGWSGRVARVNVERNYRIIHAIPPRCSHETSLRSTRLIQASDSHLTLNGTPTVTSVWFHHTHTHTSDAIHIINTFRIEPSARAWAPSRYSVPFGPVKATLHLLLNLAGKIVEIVKLLNSMRQEVAAAG